METEKKSGATIFLIRIISLCMVCMGLWRNPFFCIQLEYSSLTYIFLWVIRSWLACHNDNLKRIYTCLQRFKKKESSTKGVNITLGATLCLGLYTSRFSFFCHSSNLTFCSLPLFSRRISNHRLRYSTLEGVTTKFHFYLFM